MSRQDEPLLTPDGRYLVVSGRLWRAARPDLPDADRARLVRQLMKARRDVAAPADEASLRRARRRVHAAKVALGERGRPWWDDGQPDYNRRLVRNTPYREWYDHAADAG